MCENNKPIRVIPEAIPSVERKILCATILDAVIRFYKDPDNTAAFERWRTEKGGQAHRQAESG